MAPERCPSTTRGASVDADADAPSATGLLRARSAACASRVPATSHPLVSLGALPPARAKSVLSSGAAAAMSARNSSVNAMPCSNCEGTGHNIRTCTWTPPVTHLSFRTIYDLRDKLMDESLRLQRHHSAVAGTFGECPYLSERKEIVEIREELKLLRKRESAMIKHVCIYYPYGKPRYHLPFSVNPGDLILANACRQCGSTWVCEHDETKERRATDAM
jgi:hypothetical protein